MMTLRCLVAFVALVSTAAVAEQPLKQGFKRPVDITTGDNVTLKGTHYSPGKPGPAVLLLHQCNADRESWDPLATELTNAGMHVLTVDFRGMGGSGGARQEDRAAWPGDVEAMFAILQSFQGVDASRIAVGGASCGVAQAGTLAASRRNIKALVLLSGSIAEPAKSYLTTAGSSVAVFGAAAEGDANAAKGIADALAASKNPANVTRMIKGSAHGVPMFTESPDLMPAIVTWLKRQLQVS
jgi:alpha-beta hydrolase superfamily lysophospholipase